MTIVSCVLLVLMAAMFVNLGWKLLKYELCLHLCDRFNVKILYKGKVLDTDSVTYSISAVNKDRAALKALTKLFNSDDAHVEHVQKVVVTQVCS